MPEIHNTSLNGNVCYKSVIKIEFSSSELSTAVVALKRMHNDLKLLTEEHRSNIFFTAHIVLSINM